MSRVLIKNKTLSVSLRVRSLVPLGPDCFVTDRPDVIREWIEKAQAET